MVPSEFPSFESLFRPSFLVAPSYMSGSSLKKAVFHFLICFLSFPLFALIGFVFSFIAINETVNPPMLGETKGVLLIVQQRDLTFTVELISIVNMFKTEV